MEQVSGIEVREEEGGRVRIWTPVAEPGRGRGVLERMMAWGWAVVSVMFFVWACVRIGRNVPFEGWADWVQAGVGIVIALVFGSLGLVPVVLLRRQGRAELVVDRRGVRLRGFGPLDAWRIPLKAIREVVVEDPPEVWARRHRGAEQKGMVVKISTAHGRRYAGGVYAWEVAVELGRKLAECVGRARGTGEIEVREAASEREAGVQEALGEFGVVVGPVAEGVSIEFARTRWSGDERVSGLAQARSAWVIGGAMGGIFLGLGLVNEPGLRAAGGAMVIASLVTFWTWLVWSFASWIRYEVTEAGVMRVTRCLWWEWRRGWEREEIVGVAVRGLWWTFGRVWRVGLVRRRGGWVVIAVGRRGPAEALKGVMERGLAGKVKGVTDGG